jgi:hypothetical protein
MTLVIADIEPERGLLLDSENFLSEVGDADLERTIGGITPGAVIITAAALFLLGYAGGKALYEITH